MEISHIFSQTFDEDSWVVEVESSLEGEMRPAKFSHCLIHTIPKPLLKNKAEEFYIPQVISLGPYHFPQKDAVDDVMKLLKSEVARKMHHKIIWKGGLKSVMEKFMEEEMQEKVKESYASKEVRLGSEVLAWMMVRDACFVLEVLDRFGEDEGKEKGVSVFIDGILNRERHHPLLTEIVKDMLKMENQLPFWALKEIKPDIEDWFESALKNISPIEVAHVGDHQWYKKESHILQLLHDYTVDWQDSPASYHDLSDISNSLGLIILEFVCCFMQFPVPCVILGLWIIPLIVLLVFSPVILILFIIFVIASPGLPKWEIPKHVPTAEEPKRLGVRFKKLQGNKVGISHIEFKERNSTIYLPQFKVDKRSEVILRNLIALEICSQEEEKPITGYAILMNDLINTSEATEVPSYDPIDKAVSSIQNYRNKRWKVLWAQFIMTHCSKPWLVVSLLVGFILILLTFTQVICLFVPCQIEK